MIKTLKSELTLRPTYDELIGLINQQGDENRRPIENIIDRRATLFRNNQFGSRFDDVDFLGLKKQEEDKVKEELRQTQLRQTAMATGSSMGILSYGGRTPVGVYNADGFETPDSDYRMTAEQINRIRAELELGARRQQEAQQASSSSARSDLSDVTSQSLPAGIPIHSMVTDDEEDASADASRGSRDELPPLETPTEVAEEEEEDASEKSSRGIRDDDDDETQVPPQSRKHKETIDYNENIDRWENKDVSADDVLYQLHLRGIQLTEEQKEEMDKLKIKGKGKIPTKKDYLINYVERLIQTGRWADEVNDQLLQKRMEDWKQMKKGKGKGSGSASSSGLDTAKDIAISGVKAGVETLAKAGATALAKSFLPV